jgi:hypothetical protein
LTQHNRHRLNSVAQSSTLVEKNNKMKEHTYSKYEQTSLDRYEGIKRMRESLNTDASGASSSSLIISKQNKVHNALKLTSN